MVGLALEILLPLYFAIILPNRIFMYYADPVTWGEVRATYEGYRC